MGTGSFPGVVRPGRAADPSPPSSAAVIEEYSYTSTHPLGHTGPVTGSLYLHLLYLKFHSAKAYRRGEAQLHSFSTTEFERGEWPAARIGWVFR